MQILAKQLHRGGFTLDQVFREGNVAIYRQSKPGITNDSFEVIVIRVGKLHPAVVAQNRLKNASGANPATNAGTLEQDDKGEIYPCSEDWGKRGWTCTSHDAAKTRAIELLKKEESRGR